MLEVTSISLILENCEEILFNRPQIGMFWCNEISEEVARFASNCVSKHLVCGELFLEIHKDADQTYDLFGVTSKETKFERIDKCPDITHIDVYYNNGTHDYIAVPWDEENEYYNLYQTSYISKCGNLYILVSENRQIHEVINKEIIDCQESMDVYWDFLSE